jgi:hypothetical protein
MQRRFNIINPNVIGTLEQASVTPATSLLQGTQVQLNPSLSGSIAGRLLTPVDTGGEILLPHPIDPIPIFPFPRPIPVPTPTPQPTPVTPTSAPTDIQLLLASLPFVQDGNLISSDYFNTIRSILFAIANQLGAGLTSASLMTTIAPVFLGVYDSGNAGNGVPWTGWTSTQGYAVAQQSGANALAVSGWLIVPLPNGAQISNIVVIGRRTGYPTNTSGAMFQVQLIRQLLTDPTNSNNIATLITTDLTGADGTFTSQPVNVQAPVVLGIGQGIASIALQQELQTVDTTKYRYILVARATSTANSGALAQIFAVQINYTR